MIGKAFATVAKSACAALFALTLTGSAFAVDADRAENAAREASRRIDQDLQESARDLTTDLQRVNQQHREANRLGQADTIQNRFGTANQAEQSLQQNIREANQELRTAAERDRYTFDRRQLENTQRLYAPGTRQYNEINDRIAQLDRQFAQGMDMDRNMNVAGTQSINNQYNRDRGMFNNNFGVNDTTDQNRDWANNWDRFRTSDDMNRTMTDNRLFNQANTSSTFDRIIGGTGVYNTNMDNAANRTTTTTTPNLFETRQSTVGSVGSPNISRNGIPVTRTGTTSSSAATTMANPMDTISNFDNGSFNPAATTGSSAGSDVGAPVMGNNSTSNTNR